MPATDAGTTSPADAPPPTSTSTPTPTAPTAAPATEATADTSTDTAAEPAPAGSAPATSSADHPDQDEAAAPRGIPVPATPAEAPPLPETRSSPALRPPPPPVEEDDPETDERPLPADPFPPPFRWSAEDAEEASPDTTQVVRGAAGPAADRTQVVSRQDREPVPEETQVVRRRGAAAPPWPAPERGTGRSPWAGGPARQPPPERTQFVPGAVPAHAAGGGAVRPEDTAPPWASAAARSEGLQGRELFARGPGPRAGVILGTVALLLLVAIVLVASIALA
ncbi:hypothetical protein [Actinomycetospora lemnae]|uniref:Uncharacterized protein n=1 Tax=Actinomycetospora lemnae TaxID=3019891 RepID=A0ABT5STT6_9PSEU|nr:hypothetical protein [Actinomycetospora sp. DW7H6]MDD7966266.1 hypothetical protein [Actinomycetospora sp. DW7H6]